MKRKKEYADKSKFSAYAKRSKETYYAKTADAPRNHEQWEGWEEALVLAHEVTDAFYFRK